MPLHKEKEASACHDGNAELSQVKTEPFSSGHVDRRLAEMQASRGRGTPSPADSGATNPFSSQDFQRRLAELRQKDAQDIQETKHIQDAITKDGLLCRLLFVPGDGRLNVTGGRPVEVGDQPATDMPTQCLAVFQGHLDICCAISSPIECKFYYDSTKDAVVVVTSDSPIHIQKIAELDASSSARGLQEAYDGAPASAMIVVEAFDEGEVLPGRWRFGSSDGKRSFQLLVFPRQHSLALIQNLPLLAVAGAKRSRSEAENKPGASSSSVVEAGPAHQAEVAALIDKLDQLPEKHTVRITTGQHQDYTLFHMRTVANTPAACVFQAKHSAHPNSVVMVKALKPRGLGVVPRAKVWEAEFRIQSKLQLDAIVGVMSADARIEALYLEYVDAPDLASRKWCHRGQDTSSWHFRGDRGDAVRVLSDMSRALRHIHEARIIHNDIKPANILYSQSVGAKLIDFGLATVDGASPSSGGTPWYVAPEYLDQRQRKAPADAWATGVVMLYLLGRVSLPEGQQQAPGWPLADLVGWGNKQFLAAGRMRSWLDIVDAGREKLVEDARTRQDWLAGIVSRMLDRNPSRRISAANLVYELQGRVSASSS